MNYTKKSFTIAAPGTDAYREGWERIFGTVDAVETEINYVGRRVSDPCQAGAHCVRSNGHDGTCWPEHAELP